MRIYEKYLAKQIYAVFAFILFAFAGIFFFFDFINELNGIGRGSYHFGLAFLRVLLLAPSRFYEMMPVAALISTIYVLSQLAANSEFTIFRTSGLSTFATIRSLFKIAIPLIFITFLIGEWIGPYANQLSEQIKLKALGSSVSNQFTSGIWVKDTLNKDENGNPVTRFVNIGHLDKNNHIYNIKIYNFDANFRLKNIYLAKQGDYQPPGHWLLSDTRQIHLDYQPHKQANDPLNPAYSSSEQQLAQYSLRSDLTPKILSVLLITPDNMSIFNLLPYIQHLKDNQQDSQPYEVALWQKIFYPFSITVMMLLALPFSYIRTRSGVIGIKIFGGIMLGMSFQVLNTLFSHMGVLVTWSPIFITAIPSLIYLALSIIALKWASRI